MVAWWARREGARELGRILFLVVRYRITPAEAVQRRLHMLRWQLHVVRREAIRRSIPAQLERAGVISPGQRRAMEETECYTHTVTLGGLGETIGETGQQTPT